MTDKPNQTDIEGTDGVICTESDPDVKNTDTVAQMSEHDAPVEDSDDEISCDIDDADGLEDLESLDEDIDDILAMDDMEDIEDMEYLDDLEALEGDELDGDGEELKKQSFLQTAFEWVEMFSIYFTIGIAVLMLLFRHCPVNGESMMNTLNHNDMLILYTFAYTPENGDIIVCQSERYGLEKPLVKRVIATEGQKVRIDYDTWTVTVDGVVIEEEYILKRVGKPMAESNYLEEEFVVPEGHLFVMGDNRNNSKDSRSDEIGFIDERYVVGKVVMRVLPMSDFTVFD